MQVSEGTQRQAVLAIMLHTQIKGRHGQLLLCRRDEGCCSSIILSLPLARQFQV